MKGLGFWGRGARFQWSYLHYPAHPDPSSASFTQTSPATSGSYTTTEIQLRGSNAAPRGCQGRPFPDLRWPDFSDYHRISLEFDTVIRPSMEILLSMPLPPGTISMPSAISPTCVVKSFVKCTRTLCASPLRLYAARRRCFFISQRASPAAISDEYRAR